MEGKPRLTEVTRTIIIALLDSFLAFSLHVNQARLHAVFGICADCAPSLYKSRAWIFLKGGTPISYWRWAAFIALFLSK